MLDDFGFGSLGLDEQSLTQAGKVIQLGRPPNRIDLLTSISGVEFKEAREQPRIAGIPGPYRFFFTSFDCNEPPHRG